MIYLYWQTVTKVKGWMYVCLISRTSECKFASNLQMLIPECMHAHCTSDFIYLFIFASGNHQNLLCIPLNSSLPVLFNSTCALSKRRSISFSLSVVFSFTFSISCPILLLNFEEPKCVWPGFCLSKLAGDLCTRCKKDFCFLSLCLTLRGASFWRIM